MKSFSCKTKTVIITCFMLFLSSALMAQSYDISFEENSLQISKQAAMDKTTYEYIMMKDLYNGGEPGYPYLPVKYIRLIIPADQDVHSITISPKGEARRTLKYKIYPAQPPIPTAIESINPDFVKPLEGIYDTDKPYPAELVKVLDHGYFDGANHIVSLAIYPAQYLPKSNILKTYSSIEFNLEFGAAKGKPIIVQNRSERNQKMYDGLLERLVYNKSEISLYKAQHVVTDKVMKSRGSLPQYEYVIITDNALKNSFSRFVKWKKRKGLDIGIVTKEEIWNAGFTIDLTSGISDSAGGIRQYLHHAYYDRGITSYVLMGGSPNHVPIRHGCGSKDTWDRGEDKDANKIPADIYFAEFNGDWKVDSDDFYGESSGAGGDSPDYNQEIFIGRLMAETAQDVENWTDKVLLYEQNPGRGDYSYLTRSFMMQSDEAQNGVKVGFQWIIQHHQANKVANSLPTTFQHEIWQENDTTWGGDHPNPTFPFGHDVVRKMNLERYGLWSWFGHGSPKAIFCKSHLMKQLPVSVIRPKDDMDGESANGLDNLTNADYPAVVYSVSCSNMPFDDYETPSGRRNLGEAFTVMYDGGGPAFLGNTRFGFLQTSHIYYQKFAAELKAGNLNIGKAEAVAKTTNSDSKHYLSYSHNLIGCPEMEL